MAATMATMTGALPAGDWGELLRWLLLLALAGWLARPLAARLVPGEGGWILGKMLGWLVAGWVPWLVAALGLLPFGAAAMTGLVALALLRMATGPGQRDRAGFAGAEAAFLALFWLGLAMRLGKADLIGLEKFTDMGFLAAAMRTEFMPPEDAWFSGAALNYYYLGHAMTAAWARMAAVPADHAYQLTMATLFAFTGAGSWRIVATLVAPWGRRMQWVAGGAATLMVLYAGNFHSALYTLARGLMPTTKPFFFFADSTRFIGYDPDVPDKAFTEFPAYAFAVGDLHAHVLAMVPFLAGVCLVLAILRRCCRGPAPGYGQVAVFGWLLGLVAAMNSWDVAVLGLMALVAAVVITDHPAATMAARLAGLGRAAAVALAVASLTAAPFLVRFEPFAAGIWKVPAHTPLWQLAAVYGHVLPGLLLILVLGLRSRDAHLLPVAVVAATGLVLVVLPEFLLVRDIYSQEFARANTMFKLSFRAQHLLLLAAVAALVPLAARGGAWLAGAAVAAAPLVATLAYLPYIFQPPSVIGGLDGLAFLGDERGLVAAAGGLPLLPGESILEATGQSFTGTSRVSALTGMPTPIGWTGHEWLWRGGPEAMQERAALVDAFYTTDGAAERCRTLTRFGLRYVVLGRIEREKYPALDEAGIRALGPAVHEGPGGAIIAPDRGRCGDGR